MCDGGACELTRGVNRLNSRWGGVRTSEFELPDDEQPLADEKVHSLERVLT
jgi:hypothetical protein